MILFPRETPPYTHPIVICAPLLTRYLKYYFIPSCELIEKQCADLIMTRNQEPGTRNVRIKNMVSITLDIGASNDA